MTLAAVLMFVGCGGGSGKKSVTAGGVSRVVSARQGAFRTVIPLGYTYSPGAAQYIAFGPQENGIYDSLVVIREPVRLGDINTLVRRELTAIRRQKVHQLSRQRSSVDGEPAIAIDYLAPAQGKETHLREVFASHGQWVYVIRTSAVTTQYATSLGALEEVINNWRWR